jgi:hypothetical protein
MHTLKGHNFLISNPFLTIFSAMNVPRRNLQLFFGHHKQRSPPLKFFKLKFLCAWTLAYLHNALVNNKTSSLLDFSNDGTTNIIIANISISNIHISDLRIANIRIVNIYV